MLPTKPVAEYPGESIGERVAAKNKELRAIVDGLLTVKDVDNIIAELEPMIPSKEGGKRQRGGGWWADIKSSSKQKYDFTKAVVLSYSYVVATKTGELGAKAWPPTKEFLTREVVTPLLGDGTQAAKIVLGLAYELFRVPVTGLKLGIGGAGYLANFVAKVIKYFNEWGRKTSSYLLSDEAAVMAATSAVSTAKSAAATGTVALVVANQIGLIPLSAIVAAILFSLQLNFGTGAGRAYVLTSFYAWYNAAPDDTQKAVKKAATEYANAAASAAKSVAKSKAADVAKAAVKSAAKSAAQTLGSALSTAAKTGAAAGKNALNAVATAVADAGVEYIGPVPVDVSKALEEAAPAAALAAIAAESEGPAAPAAPAAVGAPEAAASASAAPAQMDESPVGALSAAAPARAAQKEVGKAFAAAVAARKKAAEDEAAKAAAAAAAAAPAAPAEAPPRRSSRRGGRKTKKHVAKRRVTRRLKAPKYLAAPVFAY